MVIYSLYKSNALLTPSVQRYQVRGVRVIFHVWLAREPWVKHVVSGWTTPLTRLSAVGESHACSCGGGGGVHDEPKL